MKQGKREISTIRSSDYHLKKILVEGKIDEDTVIQKFLITATKAKKAVKIYEQA